MNFTSAKAIATAAINNKAALAFFFTGREKYFFF